MVSICLDTVACSQAAVQAGTKYQAASSKAAVTQTQKGHRCTRDWVRLPDTGTMFVRHSTESGCCKESVTLSGCQSCSDLALWFRLVQGLGNHNEAAAIK